MCGLHAARRRLSMPLPGLSKTSVRKLDNAREPCMVGGVGLEANPRMRNICTDSVAGPCRTGEAVEGHAGLVSIHVSPLQQ